MSFLFSPFCVYISAFRPQNTITPTKTPITSSKKTPNPDSHSFLSSVSFGSQQYSYIMSRSCAFLVIFLVFFVSFVTPMDGRKVLISKEDMSEKQVPSLFRSLLLGALPKGTVPYSAPTKKGHATLDNEKLFMRHLDSIDRILRSVPSPGVGH